MGKFSFDRLYCLKFEYLERNVDLSCDVLVEIGVDSLETCTNHLQFARDVRQCSVTTERTTFSQQSWPRQSTEDVILQHQQFRHYIPTFCCSTSSTLPDVCRHLSLSRCHVSTCRCRSNIPAMSISSIEAKIFAKLHESSCSHKTQLHG